ncbi:MAG: hypothetical protein J6A21_04220, partial [Lentisphaeria bacterium]|nr:hypothetical protein [Lentisphaeria bacterium]
FVPFRYAEVRGFSGPLKVFQRAFFYEFDDSASDFVSSSESLDRIWELCKHTVKATTPLGVFIDGSRELQPYEGDAYINQLSYFACMADKTLSANTIDQLFLYPTWPTEWWLAMVPIIHDYALYTGDLENVRRWYGPMKKKCLLDGVCENGLLNAASLPPEEYACPRFPPGMKVHDIVDWPEYERDGYEFGTYNLVPNCWQYMALCRTAQVASLLGEESDALDFRKAAERSRRAIRETMLKNGLFVDNPGSGHTALHSCIFPVLWNVAEKEEKPGILSLMQSKGMACSVFGAQFLLECCYENGLADYALRLMLSDGPCSWNNMLERGFTMTTEKWGDAPKPNNEDGTHAWGASPGNILVRYLCGIRPLTPGFGSFLVDPQPGTLKTFRVKTPTPHGPIQLELKENGRYSLSVPPGTTALFRGRELSEGTHDL